MKNIVITGATSFLGRNTIKELLAQGEYRIFAFLRENSPKKSLLPYHKNIQYVYGSLDEIECIAKAVDSAYAFIHFGWDGSGNHGRANDDVQERNIAYSKRALQLAKTLGCHKFIFPGSQAEYGQKTDMIHETDSCNPVSPYGKAKLRFAEWAYEYVKDTDIQFIHLRIFSVYGFGDREGTLVDACIDKFNTGEIMQLGPCKQKWNYLYICDFAKMMKKIVDSDMETGIYNVASDDTRRLKEFVDCIYQMSNQLGNYELGDDASNPEKSPNLVPCIDKLLVCIGEMDFTSFDSGIRETMIQKGYLQ